jgi:hypothetical protein
MVEPEAIVQVLQIPGKNPQEWVLPWVLQEEATPILQAGDFLMIMYPPGATARDRFIPAGFQLKMVEQL